MDAHYDPHPCDLLLDRLGLAIDQAELVEQGEGGEGDE